MSKKILAAILVIVILLAGAIGFILTRDNDDGDGPVNVVENPNETPGNTGNKPSDNTEVKPGNNNDDEKLHDFDLDENGNPIPDYVPDRNPDDPVRGTNYTWGDLKPADNDITFYTPEGTLITVLPENEDGEVLWYHAYREDFEGKVVKDYSKEGAEGYSNSRYLFGEDFETSADFSVSASTWVDFWDRLSNKPEEYRGKLLRVTGTFRKTNDRNLLYVLDSMGVELIAGTYPSNGVFTEVVGYINISETGNVYLDTESIKIYY